MEAYLPHTADTLHTELIIPQHAEIANAVGAVSGGVVLSLSALIRPVDDKLPIRLYLPDGTSDHRLLEEAVAYAGEKVPVQLQQLAIEAGADQVEIRIERENRTAPVGTGHQETAFVETVITYTAVGRPGQGGSR